MKKVLCWFGLHRWGRSYVGSSWHPNLYVIACTRCGIEKGRS